MPTRWSPEGFRARHQGHALQRALRNLSGQTIDLCEATGLQYWQRIIELLATIRDSEIVMRPSFWQTLQARRARERGEQTHVVVHEDSLVFRKPDMPPA